MGAISVRLSTGITRGFMQIPWRVLQIVVFFGTIWFFTEIAPTPDVSLGAKAFMGAFFAYLATCAAMALCWLVARSKQRINNLRQLR